MADYGTGRDAAYALRLQAALEEFASQYEINGALTKKRRTIFLFPGGLGSQLMRADQPFPHAPSIYEKVWLDGGDLLPGAPDAPRLAMLTGGVDFEQRYVIADGCVNIPVLDDIVHPYANFTQWCRRHYIDLFTFGWDWRRSVQDAADFFLKVFLPMFDTRFGGQTPHPLDHFSFVGHSAGGMVVKAIMHATADQYVQRVKKAITVSTPFYGYDAQIHQYLKGPDVVPLPHSVKTKIVSSMPGGYEYLYLDHETYKANQTDFENDQDRYNLLAYPNIDRDDPNLPADPYDAEPDDNGMVRYPLHYGFESSLLYRANVIARRISSRLDDKAIAGKFYNIRGVKSENDQVANSTVVSQTWGRISPEYDPDKDPDPIVPTMGPGDTVQPAWTARLHGLPEGHVFTIVGDDIDHVLMMELPSVQKKIAELLGLDATVMTFKSGNMAQFAASRAEYNKFLEGARKVTGDPAPTPERRKAVRSAFLRNFTPEQWQRLLVRFYLDALKPPSQTEQDIACSEPTG
jgi:pimeloyl-ACP methyl ester carboxylesterase